MRRSKVRLSILVTLLGAVALIVASCGGGAATPTSQPTATPQPTAIPQPTALPQATAVSPTATPRPTATTPATPVPTAGPTRGGVLTIPILQDVAHQDPSRSSFFPNYSFAANVYSELTRYNHVPPQDELRGDLAESWTISADAKTHTYKLRAGVKFHNGDIVTSEDASFSLQTDRGRLAPFLDIVERWETPDSLTLVQHLSKPSLSLPSLLASPRLQVFSKAVWEAADGDLSNGPAIGTGPMTLKEFRGNVAVEIERNPDYFIKGLPYLDGIKAFIVQEGGTRIALFRAGRLDVIGTAATALNSETLKDLQSTNPDLQAIPHDPVTQNVVVINTAVKPWDDVRVRRALFLAIDRWSAAEANPFETKPAGPLVGPPGWGLSDDVLYKMPGYRKGAELKEDQAEAVRLLADAGFAGGLEPELIGSPVEYVLPMQEYLVGSLAEFGFKIKGGSRPSAEEVARRRAGDFELNTNAVGPFLPDPDGAALAIVPGVFTKLEDDKMADLFARQAVQTDVAKRRQLVIDLQLRMIEVANIVPTGWNTFWWAVQPEVHDLLPPLQWFDMHFDRVWKDV